MNNDSNNGQSMNNSNPNIGIPNNDSLQNNNAFNQSIQQSTSVNQITFDNQPQSTNQPMNTFENGNTNNQFLPNNQNIHQMNNNMYQQPVKPKQNKIILILAIIGGIVVAAIALFIVVFSIISAGSEKLVCKSNEGNITIMYNKSGITGYTANGMSYDLDGQKENAKQVGIDTYIQEFATWFKNNTSGVCTIDGEEVLIEDSEDKNENNNTNTITVGDNEYGYVTIPSNWSKFYDVDGNSSLQYSYANVYIVSLNYFDNSEHAAYEYASNYMYNMQNSSDVTGVTGATVKTGKNKEYTAYQVYMYYPYDSTYLITYWFEAEDGKVHYIALEGPEELSGVKITDYLYIPESFSLYK